MHTHAPNQDAPGDLEIVRDFVNSWFIPNDIRIANDTFADAQGIEHFKRTHFSQTLSPTDPYEIIQLRDDLRAILGTHDEHGTIDSWLLKHPVIALVEQDAGGQSIVRYAAHDAESLCGVLLAIVIGAIAHGEWTRLRPCRDCQWVFFDHTKNGSKVWCGMNAGGPDGRACGTIAKVSRYRARHKGE